MNLTVAPDLRRVMKLKNVTHCAVLHTLGVVLVLGDEVSVYTTYPAVSE